MAIGRTRWGFWLSFLAAGVLGLSLLVIWPFIGVPWWVGLCVVAALLLFWIAEAGFRVWRDLETAVASPGGVQAVLGGDYLKISPIPDAGAYRLQFNRTNEEARTVQLNGEMRTPVAIRFESPPSGFVHASDLPCEVKVRDGLRRHRIAVLRFIEGGVVLDDRDMPLRSTLRCTLHFRNPVEESS